VTTDEPLRLDANQFREIVRQPKAHAIVLGQYRIGEYAGVVALDRLLGEIDAGARLRRAMEVHRRDEARHTQVFADWMRRLGMEPSALPRDVEAYFAASEEEFRQQRALVDALPPEVRRICVFAGINAVERLAWTQFETHLACLDDPGDLELLRGVMAEEKFHLSYVEAELERQAQGEHAAVVTTAVEQSRAQFARFNELRRAETRDAIERMLGTGAWR
jgi:rubrerythrin